MARPLAILWLATLANFALWPRAIAAQDRAIAAQDRAIAQWKRHYQQHFGQLLSRRITRVRNVAELDATQLAQLNAAIEPALQAASTAYAKKTLRGNQGFGSTLPPELLDQLYDQLKQSLSPSDFQACQHDLKVYLAFYRSTMVDSAVTRLDEWLALSAEQRAEVRRILEAHYRKPATPLTSNFFLADNRLPNDLPTEELAGAIRVSQLKVLQAFRVFPSQQRGFFRPNEDARAKALFEAQLRLATNLRIESLDHLCRLTPAQKKKLLVLAKGVHTRLVRERDNAVNRLHAANFDAIKPRPEDYGRTSLDGARQLAIDTRWLGYVRKILTDRQRPTYDVLRQSRRELKERAVARAIALLCDGRFTLGGQQLVSLTGLIAKHATALERADLSLQLGFYMQLDRIPAAELDATIGRQHGRTLRDQIKQFKARWLPAQEPADPSCCTPP